MTLRVITASIELSGKVLRLCGPAMAHEPSGALHSARHIQRCGRFAAGSFQSIKLLCTQRVSPTCRILDTIGVGQYGPRGFEGGETWEPRRRGFRPMSDNSRNEEPETPPDEAALSARLKRLGERLEQYNTNPSSPEPPPWGGPKVPGEGLKKSNRSRSSAGSASRPVADHSGFARGFRLSSELVAGVLVGAGLGWLVDKGLGTLPWGVFVLALLGFAAGVWNVMRQAGVVSGGVPDSTIERRDN